MSDCESNDIFKGENGDGGSLGNETQSISDDNYCNLELTKKTGNNWLWKAFFIGMFTTSLIIAFKIGKEYQKHPRKKEK